MMGIRAKQLVEFVESREVRRPFEEKNVFSFRKDRPWPRLQRLCFWLLRKIGARHISEYVEFTRHTIDTHSFMERLFEQRESLMEHFNRKASRLLIGPEDFHELMGGPEIRQYLTFNTNYNHGREIMGLKVEVIPWMRGILVMP